MADGLVTGLLTVSNVTGYSADFSVAFTDDDNADSGCVIAYKLSTDVDWTDVVTTKGVGVYTASATGLDELSEFDVRAMFVDDDGVTGDNPVVGTFTTIENENIIEVGIAIASDVTASSAVVTVTVVDDVDEDATVVVEISDDQGSTWTEVDVSDVVYTPGVNVVVTLTGLKYSTDYIVRSTFTDADGVQGINPVNSIFTTLEGDALLLALRSDFGDVFDNVPRDVALDLVESVKVSSFEWDGDEWVNIDRVDYRAVTDVVYDWLTAEGLLTNKEKRTLKGFNLPG